MFKAISRMRAPLCAAAVSGAALAAATARGQATFQSLGDLPGGTVESRPHNISRDGSTVVGYSVSASGPREAFRWTAATGMQGLGDLPGASFWSEAQGVSGDGATIVGVGNFGSQPGQEAFIWTSAGGMQGLGDLPGGTSISHAFGVSGDGSIVVGHGSSASGTEAFRWTSAGGMQGLGDLPGGTFSSIAQAISGDGSTIVGVGRSASGNEAFRWTSAGGMQGLGDLPGGSSFSNAMAVSGDGSFIVGESTSAFGTEAFRWTSTGGMQGLGDLPGGPFSSTAAGVSDDGSIVVGSSFNAATSLGTAFIWTPSAGMGNLTEVLRFDYGLNLPGGVFAALGPAEAVSADGLRIAGWVANSSEAWLAVLPERPGPAWKLNGSGDWHNSANWVFPIPNGIGAEARFTRALTSSQVVFTNSPVTLGRLRFDNASSYLLAGHGTLTLQVSGGAALIEVRQGTHKINLPLIIASDTTADVAAGATLVIADPLTIEAGRTLTKTGAGTMDIISTVDGTGTMTLAVAAGTANASLDLGSNTALDASGGVTNLKVSQHVAAVDVSGSAVVALSAGGNRTLHTRALTVSGGGRLEMNDNDFIVDYAVGESSPEFALRDLVKNIAQGGTSGIAFTPGAGDVAIAVAERTEWGFSTFNGIALDDTTVIGKYTYYGDANLDGRVTSDDYVAVDVGLGVGDSWVQGDFNFSGTVTSDDYVAIDVNLGKGTPTPLAWAELKAEMIALHTEMFGAEYVHKLAIAEAEGFAALVPEPGAAGALGAAAALLIRRRRRGR